jgi:hypothetical protein
MSRVLVLNSHASTLVSKVFSFPGSINEVLMGIANFKEAGEAKENYDIRRIFDNTYVLFLILGYISDEVV